jgi:hypothetical protein
MGNSGSGGSGGAKGRAKRKRTVGSTNFSRRIVKAGNAATKANKKKDGTRGLGLRKAKPKAKAKPKVKPNTKRAAARKTSTRASLKKNKTGRKR